MNLDDQFRKADVLLEALPYMQNLRGKTFLIKVGGSAMEDPKLVDRFLRDIVFLEAVGINPVLVHGGGKAISAAMREAGLEAKFIGGMRVIDDATISIVEKTLARGHQPRDRGQDQCLRWQGGRPARHGSVPRREDVGHRSSDQQRSRYRLAGRVTDLQARSHRSGCRW